MFEILFAIFFGVFGGTMIQKQTSYCECFRDDFKGAYCQSIKGKSVQGSCKSK
jgi:hypothetical protein